MKLLVSLSALLAAALAAPLFPEMKNTLLLIPFVLLLASFSGCSSFERSLRNLPDGHFKNLEMGEAGKFSNTAGKFAVLDKDNGVIRAAGVDLRHSNIWMPAVFLKADEAVIDLTTDRRKHANPAPLRTGEPFATPIPRAGNLTTESTKTAETKPAPAL